MASGARDCWNPFLVRASFFSLFFFSFFFFGWVSPRLLPLLVFCVALTWSNPSLLDFAKDDRPCPIQHCGMVGRVGERRREGGQGVSSSLYLVYCLVATGVPSSRGSDGELEQGGEGEGEKDGLLGSKVERDSLGCYGSNMYTPGALTESMYIHTRFFVCVRLITRLHQAIPMTDSPMGHVEA
jgi:hypothetical protein